MKKKLVVLFLMMCIVMSSFIGCGGDNTSENGTDKQHQVNETGNETDKNKAVKKMEEITHYKDGVAFSKTINEYDIYGNQISQKGEENGLLNHGWEYECEYDEDGNVLVREYYDYSFKENGDFEKVFRWLARYEYDEDGNCLTGKYYDEKDALLSENEYDKYGNYVSMKSYEGGKLIREEIGAHEYDDHGRCIRYKMQEYDETGACISSIEKEFEYDENGNKVHEKSYVDGSLNEERGYTYDAYGNMLSTIAYKDGKPNAEVTYAYEYDKQGNVLKKTYSIREGYIIEVVYTYYE